MRAILLGSIVILVGFSFNTDDLSLDSRHVLDRAVMMLREQPDSIASITGFTDNPEDKIHNLALSRQRADVVERYLIEGGVERKRLFVDGRGIVTGSDDAVGQYQIVYIRFGGLGLQ